MLCDYVVIDLEMTGLKVKEDKILELGAVRVRNGKQKEIFSEILNPGVVLKKEVTELTGITNEMAQAGSDTEEAMYRFLDFLGEDVLIGQNLSFDVSFISQWAVNHKVTFAPRVVDTLKLARKFLPREQKKDLESLCTFYGIQRENAHRACFDAKETGILFEKLKMEFYEKEPEAFSPTELHCKMKKQQLASAKQIRYLKSYCEYYKIPMPSLPDQLTRSEASRITDRLIAVHGKMPK